jgi:Predicted Zn-dependent hydrolases of the beta-lactamase fold
MKITWYGHSAFRIEAGNARILIDPFLSGNPTWNGGWEGPAEGITHVLLTHGHSDHVGDALDILKKTGAMLVANAEICTYFSDKGIEKVNPGNHGGTVDCGGFTTTFVNALHSSSLTQEGGANVYLGNPLGLVLHFPDDKTLYHMGDTDIFGDMALIQSCTSHRSASCQSVTASPWAAQWPRLLAGAISASRPSFRATTEPSRCSTRRPTSS